MKWLPRLRWRSRFRWRVQKNVETATAEALSSLKETKVEGYRNEYSHQTDETQLYESVPSRRNYFITEIRCH